MKLNEIMSFDHVIEVRADGTISRPGGIYAPEIYVGTDADGQILASDEAVMLEGVKSQGWELLTGYTGQHGYNGPVMHPSESIGNRMERDILTEPGLYVALVVEVLNDDDTDNEPAGWVVAHRR